jgi:uncharacterized damage-inducible protein DinB
VITPDFVRMMARYNAWQNKGMMDEVDVLSEAARGRDRGAFFGSILNTVRHLLWGDTIWMSRFDGWDAPKAGIPESVSFGGDWAGVRHLRAEADRRILDWSGRVTQDDLSGDLGWYSGALGKAVTRPMALCVTHFFNHQTHHRGQIHAMLTAEGGRPDPTDLFILPEER